MRPSTKRAPGPDPLKPEIEISEEVGGTNGDTAGEEKKWGESLEGDEGSGGGYGRPREQGDDDQPA